MTSQTTLTALFSTFDRARKTVSSLEAAGVPADDISLIAGGPDHAAIAAGAGIGAVGGGAVGLLTGLGLISIPGLGAVVAAGWAAALAAGAVAGGALGAAAGGLAEVLSGAGVEPEETLQSLDGVRRGGTLVVVKAEDSELPSIRAILEEERFLDVQERDSLDDEEDRRFVDEAPSYQQAARDEIERSRLQR